MGVASDGEQRFSLAEMLSPLRLGCKQNARFLAPGFALFAAFQG
jgi:hypothetical protein